MSAEPIPLAGVIGAPVAHSLSPRLHGHWLMRAGARGHYVPLHVEAEDLPAVLSALPRAGFRGVNVTLPHKLAALSLATEATPAARAIGAANTLTFGPGGAIHADNTDGAGFLASLAEGCPEWKPAGRALVLGAGGAARAIVHALATAGMEVEVFNRTVERTHLLAADFPGSTARGWEELPERMPGASLLVNTTSLGMKGQPPLVLSLDKLDQATLVTDIVYSPLETELLRAAAARGNPVVDGLGMLIHQGAPGFRRWFGAEPVIDATTRAAILA